jgi:hypothetical protein
VKQNAKRYVWKLNENPELEPEKKPTPHKKRKSNSGSDSVPYLKSLIESAFAIAANVTPSAGVADGSLDTIPIEFPELDSIDLETPTKETEMKSPSKKKRKRSEQMDISEAPKLQDYNSLPEIKVASLPKETEHENYANLIQKGLIDLGGKGTVHSLVEWISKNDSQLTANRKQLTYK